MVAFIQQPTWEQSALAKSVGVSTRAIRKALDELTLIGVPLEQDKENASRVYWSVPKGWLPGARALDAEQVSECVRLLARLPRSKKRDALLEHLAHPNAILSSDAYLAEREDILRLLEDSLAQRIAVRVTYRSTTSGKTSSRILSVQRIVHGDRTRYVAVDMDDEDETGYVKWFRVDRTLEAKLDRSDVYDGHSTEETDRFIDESLDGYRGEQTVMCHFDVREPEARWIVSNLPPSKMMITRRDSSVEVQIETTAVEILARHLAGLGAAVTIHTPELKARVEQIALAALGVPDNAVQLR